MKITPWMLAAAAAFTFVQRPAWALDSSATVKATTVLQTSTTWNGQPIAYPAGTAKVTGMVVEIAPGGETGWHMHPVPSFGMVLEGELEVHLKDGTSKRLKAGEALAEVINTWHNGRNVGPGTLKLVVFYAGTTDSTLTIPEKKQ